MLGKKKRNQKRLVRVTFAGAIKPCTLQAICTAVAPTRKGRAWVCPPAQVIQVGGCRRLGTFRQVPGPASIPQNWGGSGLRPTGLGDVRSLAIGGGTEMGEPQNHPQACPTVILACLPVRCLLWYCISGDHHYLTNICTVYNICCNTSIWTRCVWTECGPLYHYNGPKFCARLGFHGLIALIT